MTKYDLTSVVHDLLEKKSLSIDQLCQVLNISRSNLHRQIKKQSGLSSSHFIRQIKLNRAKYLLETTSKTIAETSYEVGINSPKNFSKYFKEQFGVPPSKYIKQTQTTGQSSSDVLRLSKQGQFIDQQSIAVLPFDSFDNDIQQNYFSHGMSEEILFALSHIQSLRVIGKSSVSSFTGGENSWRAIGKQLQVDFILAGSVRKSVNHVRVTVRLISVVEGFQLWVEQYDRYIEDIFDIQEQIARGVIDKLKVTLQTEEESRPLVVHKTSNMEAYDLYLKGREQFELRNDLDLAVDFFNQAIALDTNFGHAHYGLGYTLMYKCIFSEYRPKDAFFKIQQTLDRAKRYLPGAGEAFILEGWLQCYFYHDLDKAIKAIRNAVHLDPGLMDAYRIQAYFCCFQGMYDIAIPLAKKAYELDPLGYNAWFSYADIHRRAGNYQEAIDLFIPLIERYPDNPLAKRILAICHYYSNDIEAAAEIYDKDTVSNIHLNLWSFGKYLYEYEYGNKQLLPDYLEELTEKNKDVWLQPSVLALINYHLGNNEEGDRLIRQAVEDMDFALMHIKSDTLWIPFRDRPVVREILKQVGLDS